MTTCTTETSLAFINPRERRKIRALEHRLRVDFEKVMVPTAEDVLSSRINQWAQHLANVEVHEEADQLLVSLKEHFEGMSKEELLHRLISGQLDRLNLRNRDQRDLNAGGLKPKIKPKAGQEVSEPAAEAPTGDTHRYFINLGMMDGLTKPDLILFLADISGVKRKSIQNVSFHKNCTFFDLDADRSPGFAEKFAGIEIEGRSLRVNRDEGGPRSKKDKGRSWEKKGGSKGKKFKAKGDKRKKKAKYKRK